FLALSADEPLPVGRARAELGRLQSRLRRDPPAAVTLGGAVQQRELSGAASLGLRLLAGCPAPGATAAAPRVASGSPRSRLPPSGRAFSSAILERRAGPRVAAALRERTVSGGLIMGAPSMAARGGEHRRGWSRYRVGLRARHDPTGRGASDVMALVREQ